ncbi:MAG: hypothetical protein ACHQEM_00565 [Chitinophagales bacterium]
MQDEVLKHGKKILHTLKDHNMSTREKIKETVIEIFIIVFAVSLSIWLHGWSEERHSQKEVRDFLKGLKIDLTRDIDLLHRNRSTIAALDSNFNFIMKLSASNAAVSDSDIASRLHYYIPVTRSNIGRYEGFKSSGKIGNIKNDSLKQNILVFYQQTVPGLVYGENFVNGLQLKILDLQMDKMDHGTIRDFVGSGKVRALFGLGAYNFEGNLEDYDRAISQARTIIAQIDAEN